MRSASGDVRANGVNKQNVGEPVRDRFSAGQARRGFRGHELKRLLKPLHVRADFGGQVNHWRKTFNQWIALEAFVFKAAPHRGSRRTASAHLAHLAVLMLLLAHLFNWRGR